MKSKEMVIPDDTLVHSPYIYLAGNALDNFFTEDMVDVLKQTYPTVDFDSESCGFALSFWHHKREPGAEKPFKEIPITPEGSAE